MKELWSMLTVLA